MDWKNRKTLVTGGASFIGSNLVNSLAARGAIVRVIDDLSSGKMENISDLIKSGKVEFVEGDLREMDVAERAVDGPQDCPDPRKTAPRRLDAGSRRSQDAV